MEGSLQDRRPPETSNPDPADHERADCIATAVCARARPVQGGPLSRGSARPSALPAVPSDGFSGRALAWGFAGKPGKTWPGVLGIADPAPVDTFRTIAVSVRAALTCWLSTPTRTLLTGSAGGSAARAR